MAILDEDDVVRLEQHVRTALSPSTSPEDLDDAINEMWVQVLTGTDEPSAPLLVTMARRRSIDRWRRDEAYRRRAARLGALGNSTSPAPERSVICRRLLADLPAHYRRALLLRYELGLSVSEVAATDGRSYRATESLLARARSAARSLFNADDRLEDRIGFAEG